MKFISGLDSLLSFILIIVGGVLALFHNMYIEAITIFLYIIACDVRSIKSQNNTILDLKE